MVINKCTVYVQRIAMCDFLRLGIETGKPSLRSRGLFVPATGVRGLSLVLLHSGEYTGWGAVINFCPFCGENLQTWDASDE